MGVESITSVAASTIADLNPAWPLGSDPKSQADDHLRLTKKALQLTFPTVTATVSASPAELNFAHKGGTVSGAAVVKGDVDVKGGFSVSGTAVFNVNVIAQKLTTTDAVTVGGGFVAQNIATFEKTVSISHIVSSNQIFAAFQASGTLIGRNNAGISCSFSATNHYKITHPLATTGFSVLITCDATASANGRNAAVVAKTSTEVDIEIHNGAGNDAASGFSILLHKF
jgi:hypothetical protein